MQDDDVVLETLEERLRREELVAEFLPGSVDAQHQTEYAIIFTT